MAEVLLGSDSNPGGRKYNEDRCAVEHFVTRSGLRLDVAVVCDGVGGEEYGERAAQLAMASTMALALIANGLTLHIANVGDSRIYLCRDGTFQQLTRDHTFANVMVWLGEASPEAAAPHPHPHKGVRGPGLPPTPAGDQGGLL